jgi:signal transduction histidine kinase
MKPEFLAEMTHELRSPLNTILGFAELMHEGTVGPVADDHKEYLGDILASGRHLLQMIDDLLDLAKLEAEKLRDGQVSPIELVSLVDGVRDLVRGRAVHRRVTIEIEIIPVSEVVGDPVRIAQIVFDALANAVNCVPEGGLVTLRIMPEGSAEFRIDVQGSGAGSRVAHFAAVLPRAMASL